MSFNSSTMSFVSKAILLLAVTIYQANPLHVTSIHPNEIFSKGDLMTIRWDNNAGNTTIQITSNCEANFRRVFAQFGPFAPDAKLHMIRNDISVNQTTQACVRLLSNGRVVTVPIIFEPSDPNLDTSFAGLDVSDVDRSNIQELRNVLGKRVDYASPKARACLASNTFLEKMLWNHVEHDMDIAEYEASFRTDGLGKDKIQHPTSAACDGPEPSSCLACFKAIDFEIASRRKALCNSDMCKNRKNVIVVGAGPVGLRMAIDARLANHSVTLVEERPFFQRHKFFGMFSEEHAFYASIGMPGSMMSQYRIYLRGGQGTTKATMSMRTKQEYLLKIARRIGINVAFGCSLQYNETAVEHQYARVVSNKKKSGVDCKIFQYDLESVVDESIEIPFDRMIVANGARSELRDNLVGMKKRPFLELARNVLRHISSVEQITEEPTAETAYYNDAFLFNQTAFEQFRSDLMNPYDDVTKKFPRLNAMVFVANADARIFGNTFVFPNSKPMNLGTNSACGSVERTAYSKGCSSHGKGSCTKEVDYRWHMELGLPPLLEPENVSLEEMRSLFNEDKGAEKRFLRGLIRETFHLMAKNKKPNQDMLDEYLEIENSFSNHVENSASFFHINGMYATESFSYKGAKAVMGSRFHGSRNLEYYIVGDALQDPWYSFGAGTHDGIRSTPSILRCLSSVNVDDAECQHGLLQHEKSLRRRMIQVLFQIYISAQEKVPDEWMSVLRKAYYDAITE